YAKGKDFYEETIYESERKIWDTVGYPAELQEDSYQHLFNVNIPFPNSGEDPPTPSYAEREFRRKTYAYYLMECHENPLLHGFVIHEEDRLLRRRFEDSLSQTISINWKCGFELPEL